MQGCKRLFQVQNLRMQSSSKKNLGQDDAPQVQYHCKARYAKDAKDVVVLWSQNLTRQNHAVPWLVAWRSCPLLELHCSLAAIQQTWKSDQN